MEMYKNIVAIWSGAIVDIPANWQICDGTNGTLDLRNYFIIGSQGNYAIGEGGGATTHVHTFTEDGHWHPNFHFYDVDWLGVYNEDTDIAVDTGTTNPKTNLPPYYALAFITRMT